MQHDVYLNPGRLGRSGYPYIAVLQSDYAEGALRLVCPLAALRPTAAARSRPQVRLGDERLILLIDLVFSIPRHALKRPVGSIANYRGDIVTALDWLFTGI